MKKLMTFTAFGLGYVLGTRAGRERYERIRDLAQTVSKNFEASDVLGRLEKYRAQIEAHASRARAPRT
jgi:hypothetical protein